MSTIYKQMIKNQVYIRKLSPEQKKQLETIAAEEGLKNGTDVFLHILGRYTEMQQELARKDRIINYKQKKINQLKGE